MSIPQNGKTLIQRMSESMRQSGAIRKLCNVRNTTSPEIAVRENVGATGFFLTWGYYVFSNARDDAKKQMNYGNNNYEISENKKYEIVKDTVVSNMAFGAIVGLVWPLYWVYRGISWGINKTV